VGNRVLGHQAGDLLSPEHADDVEPAVLQSIQREGFVRPRGRWVSASVAIKGARLAAPGVKHGHVEHQVHLVRTVQDELAPRPQTKALRRLLDRRPAEMLQGAPEMLLGDGPKMAVAVDGFLTCGHALPSWFS